MHDRNTGPANAGSASERHRLDSSSAASPSPMMARSMNEIKPAYDGPRADCGVGLAEQGKDACDPRVERLDFGEALAILRRRGRVAREGWNGKGQFIALAFGAHFVGPAIPDDRHPTSCIVISTTSGAIVPWVASQTDLLAHDWCLVREEKVLVYGSNGQADGRDR